MGEYRIVVPVFSLHQKFSYICRHVCGQNNETLLPHEVGNTVGFSAFITAALIITLHSFWFLRDCILLGSKYLPQFKVFLKWK